MGQWDTTWIQNQMKYDSLILWFILKFYWISYSLSKTGLVAGLHIQMLSLDKSAKLFYFTLW